MSEHAVTVLISRNVKTGCEADYEQVTKTLMDAAARAPGYLGAQLVHPGDDPEVEDTMYHVVLAFDQQSNLNSWQHSSERRQGMAALAPFIEGEPSFKPMSGLGLWYQTRPLSPPRWKVAVVTWLGIFPTVYVLFLLTGDLLKSWALLPRTVILTLAVVGVMTWIVAPQLTRLFRPWLVSHR
ncbi:antibiotic biosynthesis monooxygenase [Variovorax robiniae]|uniref:Antibiotic biosynthesis monooxygenase n=1 Tax=Variovorax robiniae TaxID=1836199 RepID=A0ABU8XH90_9BURK